MKQIKFTGKINPDTLYQELITLLGANNGWYLTTSGSEQMREAVFVCDNDELDISGVEAAMEAHDAGYDVAQLAREKELAYNAIDSKAGEVARKYITDRSGQESTYRIKVDSCDKWLANGTPGTITAADYPGLYGDWMARKASAPSTTVQETVDDIKATQTFWVLKMDAVELARRKGKIAVGVAADSSAIKTATTEAIADLGTL